MRIPDLVGARGIAVAAAVLLISGLHQVTPLSALHWHNVFQHLYYFPIVYAGLTFGWLGGLGAGALAGLSNAPHNFATFPALPSYATDQIFDIPLFCAAGVLTGVLMERGRKQRLDLERTTSQLTEVYRQLQENFERMKRAERLFAVGQLSAGLAHELRNPLASIGGAAGILSRKLHAEDGKGAECLAIITKECQRLNRLLTDFLDFARPRAPRYQTIDVGPALDSVLELAAHALGDRPVTLRREVAAELPPLECDPELLKQVLLNLVMNAIQAMPGGGEVTLSAKPRHDRILIQVKDQGCGIQAADRDRIFDPFFTTKESGSGLGLSVAHQIVEQHGGILTAEANPDKGMTFSLLLPEHHREAA
ncbi:MAG TPA: ATP-binding protein [Bryobacteraceae bacterium]|nr:ATP-binding protein [Bryobacteraceae bacterium]